MKTYPILAAVLLLSACGQPEVEEYSYSERWRHTSSQTDEGRVIRTENGSMWRGEAELIEEVSIGVLEGEEPYLFERIAGLAAGPDRIFILESSIPALRMYDGSGIFIKDIGIEGAGPGEFHRPDGFAVHPVDGRFYLRDTGLNRVSIWSNRGEYLGSVQVNPPTWYPRPFVVLNTGEIFTFGRWNRNRSHGMIGYTMEGATGDTIPQPQYDYERPYLYAERDEGASFLNTAVPFTPDVQWVLSPTGVLIHGLSDTYSFQIDSPNGETLVVEHAGPLVPVNRSEAEWWKKMNTLIFRDFQSGWTWNVGPIPDWKPAYQELQPDLSGRIWVHREGPGRLIPGSPEDPADLADLWMEDIGWESTKLIDVFEESGRYLGPVHVPPGFRSAPYIKGDTVLAIMTGEEGIQMVKKYRLVPPG